MGSNPPGLTVLFFTVLLFIPNLFQVNNGFINVLLFDFIKIKSTDLITNYNLSAYSLVDFINSKKNILIFFYVKHNYDREKLHNLKFYAHNNM